MATKLTARMAPAVAVLSLLAAGGCASRGEVAQLRSEVQGLRATAASAEERAARAEAEAQRAAAAQAAAQQQAPYGGADQAYRRSLRK